MPDRCILAPIDLRGLRKRDLRLALNGLEHSDLNPQAPALQMDIFNALRSIYLAS